MWFQSLIVEQFGKGQPVAGRRIDGAHGGVAGRKMVGMVDVAVAVQVAHRVHADENVGAVDANGPRNVPAQLQRGLQVGVGIAQEEHLGQTQDAGGFALFRLAHFHHHLDGHVRVVAALAAVGADYVGHVPARGAQAGHRAGAAPFGIVRVGHHHHGAVEIVVQLL